MSNLTSIDIEKGFWSRGAKDAFPPDAITYPDEYEGETNVNIVCTQLSISSYQQKKLVDQWCRLIPQLENVRYIWFHSRVNQALFDAACQNQKIEGLYIKWSGIKDLDNLRNLKQLRYLRVGSSASITSIEPIAEMDQLIVLEIENFKKIRDITPLKSLKRLEGLGIEGSTWTIQVVETLTPLIDLENLKYIFLTNLRTIDKTIRQLARIASLQHIRTAYWWPKCEFRMLRESLPELRYGSPFETDLIEELGK